MESNQRDRILFCEVFKEGRYSIMISMEGNRNIPTGLLKHIRKHIVIEYSKNISKGLLKKVVEIFLLDMERAHTKEICWRSYLHVKIVVACTALRVDDE